MKEPSRSETPQNRKDEQCRDQKYKDPVIHSHDPPMSAMQYLIMWLVAFIPVAGPIILLFRAFRHPNIYRKKAAQTVLIIFTVIVAVFIFCCIVSSNIQRFFYDFSTIT